MPSPADRDWLPAIWIILLTTAGVLPAAMLMIRLAQHHLFIGLAASLLAVAGARSGWEMDGSYWPLRDWEMWVYRALGVPLFGLFVIRGRYLKRVAQQIGAPVPPVTRATVSNVAASAATFERIHLAALIASLPLMIASWWVGWTHWTWFLLVSNVVLNVYPIMLQRYLRARIENMSRR